MNIKKELSDNAKRCQWCGKPLELKSGEFFLESHFCCDEHKKKWDDNNERLIKEGKCLKCGKILTEEDKLYDKSPRKFCKECLDITKFNVEIILEKMKDRGTNEK